MHNLHTSYISFFSSNIPKNLYKGFFIGRNTRLFSLIKSYQDFQAQKLLLFLRFKLHLYCLNYMAHHDPIKVSKPQGLLLLCGFKIIYSIHIIMWAYTTAHCFS